MVLLDEAPERISISIERSVDKLPVILHSG
jgi:hypothetical protein